MRRDVVVAGLIAVLAFVATAHAAGPERLLLKAPKGYKVVAETNTAAEQITVLVPESESVASWSDKITVQTLHGKADQSPEAYRAAWEKTAAAECAGAKFDQLKHGTENLYPMVMWSERCPQGAGGEKLTWLKAVQGRENFYLVSRTAHAEPPPKQLKAWTTFFDQTRLCDTRVPGQRCKVK